MDFLHSAWLILAIPIATSILIAAFMKQLKEPKAGWVGTIGMGISMLLSFGTLWQAISHGGHGAQPWGAGGEALVHWNLPIGGPFAGKMLSMGLMVDNLTAVMLVVVTVVSFCVQMYSISYMHGDKRYVKYFSAINLFTSGMLLAVLADNLFLLLIGWEIMGLCSYLLIGHWFENDAPQMASMKAFMTTRFGDSFMLIGVFALFLLTGTFQFNEMAAKLPEVAKAHPVALVIAALLLFGGPIGKSAQFPLHTWLPDAMAGPTPGSALIHAATMVAVGVYLVARGFTIFAVAGPEVLGVIGLVGAFTSIFAASIATVRTDIKQVLAYSTVSQLGYMMLGLGMGSFSAGTFHLTTHAAFKALLFLCSGAVIHAVHTQEMHQMGGLRKKLPITFLTWMAGYLALAGFPGFAGFFSKDELLLAAFNFPHSDLSPHSWPTWVKWLPFLMGAGTAFLTAYYMTRATILTFFGKPRDQHAYDHAHESPWLMWVPLVILAIPSVLLGWTWAALPAKWFGAQGLLWWEHFTENPFQVLPHEGAATVTSIATLLGLSGILVGYLVYGTAGSLAIRKSAIRALQPLYTVLKNKYYVDELYHATAVAGTLAASRAIAWFDRTVVDGAVNLVGWIGEGLSTVHGWFDNTFVDGAVNLAGYVTVWSGRHLRRLSTGQVQSHMMTFAVLVVFGAVAVWLTFSR